MKLEVIDFPQEELPRLQRLVDAIPSLKLQTSGGMNSGELGMSVAVVMYLDRSPTEAQLELVQRLGLLKTPAIAVVSSTVPERDRLLMVDSGFIGVVNIRAFEHRMSTLLEMFVSRAKILKSEFDEKTKVASESDDILLFCSPEVRELLSRLSRVATLGSTIMLTGETGVGKSSIARWIHENSSRSEAAFVDVPCAALPTNLIESELFGHVRGSFTSADRDHVGKFKVAGKGTLLLDEIDCLPLEVQGKLLRAVERREFERVGSTATERFEARLIVATNRPLDLEVQAGRFRSDLFYRLGVLSFRIPALRERTGAILPLAEMFLKRFATEHARPVRGMTAAAMHALEQYTWPGNIRELRNSMEYAVAVSTGDQIQWADIPESVRDGETQHANAGTVPTENGSAAVQVVRMREPEVSMAGMGDRERMLHVLRKHGNNRSRAAQELGISRVTLYKRMDRLGIQSIYAG